MANESGTSVEGVFTSRRISGAGAWRKYITAGIASRPAMAIASRAANDVTLTRRFEAASPRERGVAASSISSRASRMSPNRWRESFFNARAESRCLADSTGRLAERGAVEVRQRGISQIRDVERVEQFSEGHEP